MEQFFDFTSVVYAILKLFVVLSVGYFLSAKRLIKKEGLDGLNIVLLWALLPSLMVTRIIGSFDPASYSNWWLLPLLSILMSFLGLFLGAAVLTRFKEFSARREFMSVCAYQNAGYLPMALIAFTCKGAFCDQMLVYTFLFLIGFNFGIWAFLPRFFDKNTGSRASGISILSPPFVATVVAVASVFMFGRGWMPAVIFDPLQMLGRASFAVALITVGAYLCEYRAFSPDSWKVLSANLAVKLFMLPMAVLLLLSFTNLDSSYRFFIFLQAVMPSAVTTVVIGHYKQADNKFLSAAVFYSHLLAIVTIPVNLWIFRLLG